ncbi:MAG TPA: TatD family hydrolase [Thermoplasmata archaeon]
MALPSDLPIVDHHAHLSPSGEGVGAARRFRAAGGTHLFLATQGYDAGPPLTTEGYQTQFETTERLARRVEADTGVVVYLVVAPYPVDLVRQSERLGVRPAVELQLSALALSGRWVEEQRAVALGEVGRPHFPTEPAIQDASEEVFRRALEVARDAGCPAVVHCEDLTSEGYRALAGFASTLSFPLGRLVKHYDRTVVPTADRLGIVPSYIARKDVIERSQNDAGPWFLETDFLDDPARPGAVLDLATVPRRARAIAASGPEGAERLRIPFVDSVRAVYGFAPTVGAER